MTRAYGAGAPCGCSHRAGGDQPTDRETSTMQEGTWQNVSLGADAPRGVLARGTLVPSGPFLHAYLKFRMPHDPKVYMVHASIDLRDVEREMNADAAQKLTNAVSGGKIWRRMKKGIKSTVRTIARSKLVKGVIAVAKKALNNPLIKGVLSATPMGAGIMMAAAAARVAAKAIKGGLQAKKVVKAIAARAKAGHPDAIKAARLMKAGMKLTGITPQSSKVTAAAASGDERHYLSTLLGACVDCPPSNVQLPYLVGCGADDEGDLTHHELEAVDEFATAGAFEGIRWLASRLGPHSMLNRPDEFTKRDALSLGLQVMSQPRH